MSGQHIIIQGHFLHHPFSGQGVFLEEMLRSWTTHSEHTWEILLWYKTEAQRAGFIKQLAAFPDITPVFRRLPIWLPFRAALGFWEFIWIPFYLRRQKQAYHYFSPTLHPMLFHPKSSTRSLQMVLHDTFQFTEKAYTGKLTRKLYNMLLLRTARHRRVMLWTVSETSRQEIEAKLTPQKQVHVTGNGIDHLQQTPPAPWKDVEKRFGITKPYILYQGGYDERKNVGALIETFRRLRATHPMLQLVLCGNSLHASALYENLHEHAKEPGIIHTGFVDRGTLRTLLAHTTVLASPARAEGFNINIGEGLMEGATVIASDIPVHRELWYPYALLTDFTDASVTDALFEKVLSSTLKSPILPPEYVISHSWCAQSSKILPFFV